MVCINRQFIGVWSKLYEQDEKGPLSSQTFYDDAQTEYFEYDGSDFDVELLSTQTRHYDPTVGRWLSEDPIGFEGGVPKVHCYPGNAPQ